MATKNSTNSKKSTPKEMAKPAKKPPRVPLAAGAKKPTHFGGLGRGLDALIQRGPTQGVNPATSAPKLASATEAASAATPSPAPAAAPADSIKGRVIEVPIDSVHPSPWQPRRVFDDEKLHELADSIRVHGVIQPLVCRVSPSGSGYELIGGERRLRAAGLLGRTSIPIIVMEAVDHDAAELALVENLQREDLNVIEEAEGYKALADEFKLTQADIAERVGKARASVANTLRLLELPDEVKQMLGAGMISTGHAKVLLGIEGERAQTELAHQCIQDGLTVRALERRLQRKVNEKAKPSVKSDVDEAYLQMLLTKLHERFATAVRLVPSCTYANGRRGRGRIEIDYFNNDDLSRLLELLGVDINDFD